MHIMLRENSQANSPQFPDSLLCVLRNLSVHYKGMRTGTQIFHNSVTTSLISLLSSKKATIQAHMMHNTGMNASLPKTKSLATGEKENPNASHYTKNPRHNKRSRFSTKQKKNIQRETEKESQRENHSYYLWITPQRRPSI
jgi:hypothetical protein